MQDDHLMSLSQDRKRRRSFCNVSPTKKSRTEPVPEIQFNVKHEERTEPSISEPLLRPIIIPIDTWEGVLRNDFLEFFNELKAHKDRKTIEDYTKPDSAGRELVIYQEPVSLIPKRPINHDDPEDMFIDESPTTTTAMEID